MCLEWLFLVIVFHMISVNLRNVVLLFLSDAAMVEFWIFFFLCVGRLDGGVVCEILNLIVPCSLRRI